MLPIVLNSQSINAEFSISQSLIPQFLTKAGTHPIFEGN